MYQVLAGKNVQKTTFEAAEMIFGPWNQQECGFNLEVLLTKVDVNFKSQRTKNLSFSPKGPATL